MYLIVCPRRLQPTRNDCGVRVQRFSSVEPSKLDTIRREPGAYFLPICSLLFKTSIMTKLLSFASIERHRRHSKSATSC